MEDIFQGLPAQIAGYIPGVAAVNRVGEEGRLQFWGGSFVSDAFGNVLERADDTTETILQRADETLYRAKRLGRNQVQCEQAAAAEADESSPEVSELASGGAV